jgi:23S rRNA pseudouridine2605 synthase
LLRGKISGVAGTVRLDRALSKLGLASRSEAKRLILDGEVAVRGRIVVEPAYLVVPERARITVRGATAPQRRWRLLAFHKPRGTVTTRRDPEGRKTVFDAIGSEADGLIAVGRLDLASTGLLLLTSDTQFANWLTDPKSAIARRYVVTVRGRLTDEHAQAMEAGIAGLRATEVTVRKASARETHLIVELSEGRNREIRRLVESVGLEVTRLLRVAFGPIELGTLQPGEWREISIDAAHTAFKRAPINQRAGPASDRSRWRGAPE